MTLSDKAVQFELLNPKETRIDFVNWLNETPDSNILLYEYFYNGGGVATADFNGDNLIDIFFTSNMSKNRLFLNEGDLKFKEVTERSGLEARKSSWKTGVTYVDINADGLLDIYVCYSGPLPQSQRRNQLFINEGNNTDGIPIFKEKAKEYGLDSPAFSNQGYFFDYDADGDLDMLLLNHNIESLPLQNVIAAKKMLQQPDTLMGLRLFEHIKDNKFIDVTESAGINGSALNFGLGIGMGDLDNDGKTDFYVCNDYDAPDYIYKNNGDGTFSDVTGNFLGHTSQFSMGNDVVDLNNDGHLDIVTLDMMPEENDRQKLAMTHVSRTKFDLAVEKGFHHQHMRNMVHINNGNSTFSEIGQALGVDKTDWSWSVLLADYDNDGFKDMYVTNGYFRDFTNMDFINYMDEFSSKREILKREEALEMVQNAPQSEYVNYMFKGLGNTFRNATIDWGMGEVSNSNGAAYADLDNDGDLELIVNNINKPAFIYKNLSEEQTRKFLDIKLEGENKNTLGIGVEVTVFLKNNEIQKLTQFPARGYLSAVTPILHFGFEELEIVDSLMIKWPAGKTQLLKDIETNQVLVLKEKDANQNDINTNIEKPIFQEIPSPIKFVDAKSNLWDFDRQSLLTFQLSHTSPIMSKADLNEDGNMDIIIGGNGSEKTKIYYSTPNGDYTKGKPLSGSNSESTVQSIAIFDADGDGKDDIFLANGGYGSYLKGEEKLQDQLFLNQGDMTFEAKKDALPAKRASSKVVIPADIDNDGDMDIFVGGGFIPGRYPESSVSQLLVNDGKGRFSDLTEELAEQLKEMGNVSDAIWSDVNNDGQIDLVTVGKWSPISIYLNQNGKFSDRTTEFVSDDLSGWWNTITSTDINNDGTPDFIIGNEGLNTRYKASKEKPITLVYEDFDGNGSIDPILNYHQLDNSYPDVTRDELKGQIASFGSKYPSYKSFANETITDIFNSKSLENAKKLETNIMHSIVLLSQDDSTYEVRLLPFEAQYAPISNIMIMDVNEDGKQDLALFGNRTHNKLIDGRTDANYGVLLIGAGNGDFKYVPQTKSGFKVKGDIKSVVRIGDILLIGRNQKSVIAYKIN